MSTVFIGIGRSTGDREMHRERRRKKEGEKGVIEEV